MEIYKVIQKDVDENEGETYYDTICFDNIIDAQKYLAKQRDEYMSRHQQAVEDIGKDEYDDSDDDFDDEYETYFWGHSDALEETIDLTIEKEELNSGTSTLVNDQELKEAGVDKELKVLEGYTFHGRKEEAKKERTFWPGMEVDDHE